MSDNISQIKDRLNLVDVIAGYIKVQKAGANFKARCPFHNEKTPSFYISPERQIWHCFGCSIGGDVFGFVKQIEGVEFGEALRILAQKAGIKLERYDPEVQDIKTILYEICESATRFFEKQLYYSSLGKKALAYLKDRGLEDAVIKEFRLGFAPDDWHALGKFLRDCGYKNDDILNSGLVIKRQNYGQSEAGDYKQGTGYYDRFRSRIIFPIADTNDRVIGFSGRIFASEDSTNRQPPTANHQLESESTADNQQSTAAIAKYINTPQTLIYDKSRILYGLNKAKMEMRRADRGLLVEGNIDVIMSYQAGVKNVAGTSGTALTPSHLQLLQRYTKNLDFCFDSDQAGLAATRRGIGLALSHDFNVKIVSLNEPGLKDPADYVKKFGSAAVEKWQGIVRAAKPAIEFYFDKICSDLDLGSVSGKKGMIGALAPLINRLVSQVEKAHWLSRIAAILKIKEEVVEADIASAKDDLDISYSRPESFLPEHKLADQAPAPDDVLGQTLLAVILKNPALFKTELSEMNIKLVDSAYHPVLAALAVSDFDNFKFGSFVNQFGEKESMKIEFANLRSQELFRDFSDNDLLSEFRFLKNKIEKRALAVRLADLELEIKSAEAVKDKTKLTQLLSEFNSLAKKLNSY